MLLLAPLAGCLITLSLAPFNLWPAGILSCALYSALLCTCSPRQALWRGWLFGLGLFGSGVSWVYVSIHVHGYASVGLAVFLTALFCAGLALLHSLFAWCYVRWIRPLPGGMLLGFAVLWLLFEWLRSWLLTGFPWLFLGYAHIDTWLAGWAPIGGVYALSLITALSGSCLFLAWRSRQAAALLTYAVIVTGLWGGGALLKNIQWVAPASQEPLNVALFQPNIPQQQKWNPAWLPYILQQYENSLPTLDQYDLVLWPESAIPRYFQDIQPWFEPIIERARHSDSTLITGIPYRGSGQREYFNSIMALGQGQGVYHKQRLVPFGEYVPLENWLRGLIDFFDLPMSAFSPGPADQAALQAGAFRVAPYICYEVVYPQLVAESAQRSDLLVTISNDSWFGDSIGPLQHLEMARMRALENGRYLLRGTNNGVSAIIDHRGQILVQSEQFISTLLVGQAQVMLGGTPFGSFGTMPLIVACFLALAIMGVMRRYLWREGA